MACEQAPPHGQDDEPLRRAAEYGLAAQIDQAVADALNGLEG